MLGGVAIRDARPASPDAELCGGPGRGRRRPRGGGAGCDLQARGAGPAGEPGAAKVQKRTCSTRRSRTTAAAPSRRNSLSSAGRPATPEPVSQPPAVDFSDVEELRPSATEDSGGRGLVRRGGARSRRHRSSPWARASRRASRAATSGILARFFRPRRLRTLLR